jgi:hypothetical protein
MDEVVRECGTPRFYVSRQRNNLALIVNMPGTVDKVDTALATKSLSDVNREEGIEKLVGLS